MQEIYSSPPNTNFLSGYFDANVISTDKQFLLCSSIDENFTYPNSETDCSIYLINLKSAEKFNIGNTNCFNFQQGCRATFFTDQNEEKVIFNCYSHDLGYHAIISNLDGFSVDTIPCPAYSVSSNPSIFASVDMRRHDILKRGYSYGHYSHLADQLKSYKSDSGLRIFDLKTRGYIYELYLHDLPTFASTDNQYFDHPLFNLDGSKLAFYHRILDRNEIISHLYILNLSSGKLKCLYRLKRGTHFSWIDNDNIVAWGSLGTLFTSFRSMVPKYALTNLLRVYKRIVSSNSETGNSPFAKLATGDNYLFINTDRQEYQALSCLSYDLNRDGHPTIIDNKRLFITDTYPDDQNICKLICVDLENDLLLFERHFAHNPLATRTPFRADLHPKVSKSGSHITIDTFSSYRQVKVFAL